MAAVTQRKTHAARSKRIAGIREMWDWLEERPEMPLPLWAGWTFAEDPSLPNGLQFHVTAEDRDEFERLATLFDEDPPLVERYPRGMHRRFAGEVSLALLLER